TARRALPSPHLRGLFARTQDPGPGRARPADGLPVARQRPRAVQRDRACGPPGRRRDRHRRRSGAGNGGVGTEPQRRPAGDAGPGISPAARVPPAPVSLDDAMREHLRAALHGTGWHISRTAAPLGISRTTLRARTGRLGLREGAPSDPPVRRAPVTPAPGRPAPAAAALVEPGLTTSPAAAVGGLRARSD